MGTPCGRGKPEKGVSPKGGVKRPAKRLAKGPAKGTHEAPVPSG